MNGRKLFQIRDVTTGDHAFIFATWLRNLWYHKDNTTTLAKETFMRLHHGRIEKVLRETPVKIACLTDDPDVILGYVAQTTPPFVYIKKAWRPSGIDKHLLGAK